MDNRSYRSRMSNGCCTMLRQRQRYRLESGATQRLVDLTLTLRNGWRRGNISWRPTTWELRQLGLGAMRLDAITEEDYRRLGLAQDHMALRAIHVGEYGEHAIAKRAGLQKGDIIVSFDGKDRRMTESELLAYTLQQKRPGDPNHCGRSFATTPERTCRSRCHEHDDLRVLGAVRWSGKPVCSMSDGVEPQAISSLTTRP